MKRLSAAFSYIFSDIEWFNKVLIGGFYFILIPFGIGIIMLNGFLHDLTVKLKNGESGMPLWRNYKTIFNDGLKKSWIPLFIIAAEYGIFVNLDVTVTISSAILLIALFLTINTIVITKTFDLSSLVISLILLITAISIGWMWIVVGWTLLIFLAMLVQTYLFVKK